MAESALPDKLDLLWTFEAGSPIISTAAIADGVAYVGTEAGDLLAINMADGSRKWRYETGGALSSGRPR